MSFANKLITWYKTSGRELPWRDTHDPYIIWLSEVILQQTRVEQGLPYFYAFVESFPTVVAFAAAEEDDILRLWQGLGYYSRARNMYKAAKLVVSEFNGEFPTSYKDLLRLPGVGSYTAAAVSSFSINERYAVLDGNVFRVLGRFFGISLPINSIAGKKVFQELAQELISEIEPGQYNHAIMDFGATLCKPKAPLCDVCMLREECVAYAQDKVALFPVKNRGKKSKDRYFNYFLIESAGAVLMEKRGMGDVWANMYELPLIETEIDLMPDALTSLDSFKKLFGNVGVEPLGGVVKQVLSHQNIYARFYRLTGENSVLEKKGSWNYILLENLDKLAKHKLIFSFIDKYLKANSNS